MFGAVQGIDEAILVFIKANLHNPILDKIMIFFTNIGEGGAIWITIAIALLLTKKYRKAGITMFIALIFSQVIGEMIIKNIVQRPRPSTYIAISEMLIKKPNSFSFPSGHTSSVECALVISYYFRNYGKYIWIPAILIAFSRLYLYVHYPSDIIGGAVLGLICGYIGITIWKRIENREIFKKINKQ